MLPSLGTDPISGGIQSGLLARFSIGDLLLILVISSFLVHWQVSRKSSVTMFQGKNARVLVDGPFY